MRRNIFDSQVSCILGLPYQFRAHPYNIQSILAVGVVGIYGLDLVESDLACFINTTIYRSTKIKLKTNLQVLKLHYKLPIKEPQCNFRIFVSLAGYFSVHTRVKKLQ